MNHPSEVERRFLVQPDPQFPPDAPEGDGWVVQICSRLNEQRSDLLLFDALEIAKGPIATINIPIRMRFGVHGNWVDAAHIGLNA